MDFQDVVTQFAQLILDTKNYQPPISLDLLLILSQRMQLVTDYYTQVSNALQRHLTENEKQTVTSIHAGLNTNLAAFQSAKIGK